MAVCRLERALGTAERLATGGWEGRAWDAALPSIARLGEAA